jgi:hypothetical protein
MASLEMSKYPCRKMQDPGVAASGLSWLASQAWPEFHLNLSPEGILPMAFLDHHGNGVVLDGCAMHR